MNAPSHSLAGLGRSSRALTLFTRERRLFAHRASLRPRTSTCCLTIPLSQAIPLKKPERKIPRDYAALIWPDFCPAIRAPPQSFPPSFHEFFLPLSHSSLREWGECSPGRGLFLENFTIFGHFRARVAEISARLASFFDACAKLLKHITSKVDFFSIATLNHSRAMLFSAQKWMVFGF